jgi:hypothetical protein
VLSQQRVGEQRSTTSGVCSIEKAGTKNLSPGLGLLVLSRAATLEGDANASRLWPAGYELFLLSQSLNGLGLLYGAFLDTKGTHILLC